MNLEITNKLFLELSQVVTAETARELNYKATLQRIRDYPIATDPAGAATTMREIAREGLKRAEFV
jgi:hypothetical protein